MEILNDWYQSIESWFQAPWAQALGLFVGALLVALLVHLLFVKVLMRLVGKTETELDDRFFMTFQKPIAVSIILAGVWFAIGALYDNPLVTRISHGILTTFVILSWMFASLSFSKYLVNWMGESKMFKMVEPRTQPILHIVFKLIIILGSFYFFLIGWRLDVTAWFASSAVVGVAIGFAAKDTLANFFSGIFIIADAPYKIGDYIVLGNGDRGRVTDIGIRSTRLLTRDDVEIIIPNAIIATSEIFNQSGGPDERFRVRVKLQVAYGSDVDKVRKILMDIALSEELVAENPTPRLRFRAFGDSGLDYELLVWVALPELRGKAMDNLLTTIYKTFAAENIEIPYPKQDIYLYKMNQNNEQVEGESNEEPPSSQSS